MVTLCTLCTSPAGVGDLGRCVVKQITLLTVCKELPCFQRHPLMPRTEVPFELTHKWCIPLYPRQANILLGEREGSENLYTLGCLEEGTKFSVFESESAKQNSRSWFYQSGLKCLQPRSRELLQHEVCIGS